MTKFNCNCICKYVCHWRIELEQLFYRMASPNDCHDGSKFNWEKVIAVIESNCPNRTHILRRLEELRSENNKEQN